MNKDPYEVWDEACWKAKKYVEAAAFEDAGDLAIEVAHDLLAAAHQLKGVACPMCNGYGRMVDTNKSTWKRAVAAQAATKNICKYCWGTGRTDLTGTDLIRVAEIEKQNEHLHLRMKSLTLENIEALEEIEKWKLATGLEKGGDPDEVTPDDLYKELALLRAIEEGLK